MPLHSSRLLSQAPLRSLRIGSCCRSHNGSLATAATSGAKSGQHTLASQPSARCHRLHTQLKATTRPHSIWKLHCAFSTSTRALSSSGRDHYNIRGENVERDSYSNIPQSILSRLNDHQFQSLPYIKDHPLELLRNQIESHLASCRAIQAPSPVVSTQLNFEDLGIPPDHPGRSPTDTYYVNRGTVLRTHTSAHEVETFRAGEEKWLLTADVYRRDEIDSSHYPIFHQMEGASIWSTAGSEEGGSGDFSAGGAVERECEAMEAKLREAKLVIEDPVSIDEAGGWQANHLQDPVRKRAAELSVRHLKASLNGLVLELFGPRHAENVRRAQDNQSFSSSAKGTDEDPLRVRWIPAFFPFTSPSYEVEVWYAGKWLEILGCGIVNQRTLDTAGVSKDRVGWAFGLGLERIAMILFSIPDIRLFWSQDRRFLDQFKSSGSSLADAASTSPSPAGGLQTPSSGQSASGKPRFITFKPFSRYPPCYKDVSFWLPQFSSFHENDLMELIRETATASLVESVTLIDSFTHPKTGRDSRCYRINYRDMERNLENEEVNEVHDRVVAKLVGELGIEVR